MKIDKQDLPSVYPFPGWRGQGLYKNYFAIISKMGARECAETHPLRQAQHDMALKEIKVYISIFARSSKNFRRN